MTKSDDLAALAEIGRTLVLRAAGRVNVIDQQPYASDFTAFLAESWSYLDPRSILTHLGEIAGTATADLGVLDQAGASILASAEQRCPRYGAPVRAPARNSVDVVEGVLSGNVPLVNQLGAPLELRNPLVLSVVSAEPQILLLYAATMQQFPAGFGLTVFLSDDETVRLERRRLLGLGHGTKRLTFTSKEASTAPEKYVATALARIVEKAQGHQRNVVLLLFAHADNTMLCMQERNCGGRRVVLLDKRELLQALQLHESLIVFCGCRGLLGDIEYLTTCARVSTLSIAGSFGDRAATEAVAENYLGHNSAAFDPIIQWAAARNAYGTPAVFDPLGYVGRSAYLSWDDPKDTKSTVRLPKGRKKGPLANVVRETMLEAFGIDTGRPSSMDIHRRLHPGSKDASFDIANHVLLRSCIHHAKMTDVREPIEQGVLRAWTDMANLLRDLLIWPGPEALRSLRDRMAVATNCRPKWIPIACQFAASIEEKFGLATTATSPRLWANWRPPVWHRCVFESLPLSARTVLGQFGVVPRTISEVGVSWRNDTDVSVIIAVVLGKLYTQFPAWIPRRAVDEVTGILEKAEAPYVETLVRKVSTIDVPERHREFRPASHADDVTC